MTKGKVSRLVKCQSMLCGIDMCTHVQPVSVQSGPELWARAKPEEKNKDNSGGVKSVILNGVR